MADLTALDDIDHYWGQDASLSAGGDFARANRALRSKQRILRRLLTNPGDYIFQPTYGAGLPKMVGQLVDAARIRGVIRGQMMLEASVARSPAPTIDVQAITNGVAVRVSYTVLPDRQPVALSFEVKP